MSVIVDFSYLFICKAVTTSTWTVEYVCEVYQSFWNCKWNNEELKTTRWSGDVILRGTMIDLWWNLGIFWAKSTTNRSFALIACESPTVSTKRAGRGNKSIFFPALIGCFRREMTLLDRLEYDKRKSKIKWSVEKSTDNDECASLPDIMLGSLMMTRSSM